MDDHMYENILSYAECELIPRFQKEYTENQNITKCTSYQEIKDLCSILNIVAKWAGYSHLKVSDFINHKL